VSHGLAWVACIVALPSSVVVAAASRLGTERLRNATVVCAGLLTAVCALVFVDAKLATFRLPWPYPSLSLVGDDLLRVDAFAATLIPLPAALWLLTVAVTPRSRLDRAGLPRTAMATLSATLAFLTESPLLLVVWWVSSILLFSTSLSPRRHRRVRAAIGTYLWTSTLLLGTGVVAISSGRGAPIESAGSWLVVLAVFVRKGIFPFHAWIPESFDRGRLGPTLLFSAPQMGTYVASVLVLPRANGGMLRLIAILSLASAVYGAALSLIQSDARRASGYLFVSQSALVLAGLACTGPGAVAGALVLWLSSALAFTALARSVLALEARRGRLDLTRHHGGYEQMPLLAVTFLVFGMACTGFPGTLGFVGEEMLLAGAVEGFPVLGFLVVVASSLTGISVLRMYFSLFCGSHGGSTRLPLLRREAIAFAAVTAVLVLGGLFPQPIVASRMRASHSLLLDGVESGHAR
jgi:NADH-quinone oxidoreductase subunit M